MRQPLIRSAIVGWVEQRETHSVPLWLGAFTRSKTSMSGPVGVGGFEEGEFEGDGPLEKVAAVG